MTLASILVLSPVQAKNLKIAEPVKSIEISNKNYHQVAKKVTSGRTSGWSVRTGDDLETVLKQWASRAGWNIVWKSDNAYHLAGSTTFTGSFLEALDHLMTAMQDARPAPIANIYTQNQTIVVTDGLGETF